MNHIVAAACNTGTAWQQYVCSHPGTDPNVARAGYEFGHAAAPVLIVLVILTILFAIGRRRSRKAAPASR